MIILQCSKRSETRLTFNKSLRVLPECSALDNRVITWNKLLCALECQSALVSAALCSKRPIVPRASFQFPFCFSFCPMPLLSIPTTLQSSCPPSSTCFLPAWLTTVKRIHKHTLLMMGYRLWHQQGGRHKAKEQREMPAGQTDVTTLLVTMASCFHY